MAVNDGHKLVGVGPKNRRLMVGTNVLTMAALAVAATVFIQLMGRYGGYADMSSTRVNTLSDPTKRLLAGLDQNVRLISMYFKNEAEHEDQAKFRERVDDLLALYESANRSRISREYLNPLQDHEKRIELFKRLEQKPRFQKQVASYQEVLDDFNNRMRDEIAGVIFEEIQQLTELSAGLVEGGSPLIPQIKSAFEVWQGQIEDSGKIIQDCLAAEPKAYADARAELSNLYSRLQQQLELINSAAAQELSRNRKLSEAEKNYLMGIEGRFAAVLKEVTGRSAKVAALEPLELDEITAELAEATANPIVVETDDDVAIVSFDDVWPAMAGGSRSVEFEDRAFKGEEQLSAAILRTTHQEQTAVIFVQYGGPPLFFGGMQGMPEAPYAQMRGVLEDLNFKVESWDLKAGMDMPKIDPTPTRNIFVVLPPVDQSNPMMGQQDAPFTEEHKNALTAAMGKEPRAIFLAGWMPGPMGGVIPASYPYNDYLEAEWGISVDLSTLLLQFQSTQPGQYMPTQRTFFMTDVLRGDQLIAASLGSSPIGLPQCAPLKLTAKEGVTQSVLLTAPKRDGLWGVKNIQRYVEQLPPKSEFMTKVEGDEEGPFEIAVAAQKDEGKIVVVGSTGFAEDKTAFAMGLEPSPRGFRVVNVNPGNLGLFINSLHWLNDNEDFMNLGKPIQLATLDFSQGAGTFVRVFTQFAWPAVALLFGLGMWFVRRR